MASVKKTGKSAAAGKTVGKGPGIKKTAGAAAVKAAPSRTVVKSGAKSVKPAAVTVMPMTIPNTTNVKKYAAANIYRSGDVKTRGDAAAAGFADSFAAFSAMKVGSVELPADFKAAFETAARGIEPTALPSSFKRADLEFHGVDHSGASYEARIFLNNSAADGKTATTIENGYAGSFHVFGHGGCYGDIGHCEINRDQRDFDPRLSNALKPIKKVVIATDAIKRALSEQGTINVTVVPLLLAWTDKSDVENVLKFDRISLVTYN